MFTCTLSFSGLHESTSQSQVRHEVRGVLGHGVLSTVTEFLELSQECADRVSFLHSYKHTKHSQRQGSNLNHNSHKICPGINRTGEIKDLFNKNINVEDTEEGKIPCSRARGINIVTMTILSPVL